jgi:histidinol-phosphate phosphatase family protein
MKCRGRVASRIVFLDRDGTVNKHRHDYVKNLSEFVLLPDVAENLARLSAAGFKLVVITNQSAINRGLLGREGLKTMHGYMISELRKQGCFIDKIYFCPHTPEEHCACRKPGTALFEKAVKDFAPVDLKHSWMIGDSVSDIKAGVSFGLNTYKVRTNGTLKDAVDIILKEA